MKRLLPLTLLLLTVAHAQAENTATKDKLKEYDVEIIIFEDVHSRYLASQTWGQDEETAEAVPDTAETKAAPENLDSLSVSEIKATSYKTIKPAILNKEYKRINNARDYNVLFYGSWRQTGLDEKKAFNIDIEELENNHKTSSKNTLSGNFKLVLSRYLHIYSDLDYQRNVIDEEAAVTSIDNADPALAESPEQIPEKTEALVNPTYPLDNHRRMRSKVLHYIDHPLVGILIQINPVEPVTEEAAEKSAAL